MPNIRLLVPEATVNYITNPELRYATTGWTAAGSVISRDMNYARFGIASLKVVTAGSALREGTFFRVSSLQGVSDSVTVSAYVRGEGRVRIRVIDNPFGKEYYSQPKRLDPNRWTRMTVSGRISGTAAGNDIRLYVETDEGTAKIRTFYVDGAQMELKPYATTYCSGSQAGCKWNIVDSGSQSVRTVDTRLGGRWVDIAGPCRDDDDLYVTVLGGMGSASIKNQTQPFALAPGSFFQGYKIEDRVVTLGFHVKHKSLTKKPTMSRLHELRQQLIDIVKPDKTIGSEPFMLEYSDDEGTRALYSWFRYEAGLEGEWDMRNGWVNSFPLRLIAVDPFWYEDNQEVKQLALSSSYNGTANWQMIFNKKQDKWSRLGLVVNNDNIPIVEAPDGSIYIGVIPTAGNYVIYKWDGVTLSTFATASYVINSLAIGGDGTLYAGGQFNSIGGVAASRIAKCDLSTGVWSAMGAGVSSGAPGWTVYAICVADNGQVYIGGDFTSAGGVACLGIARWDGFQWRTVGATSGFDNPVLSIAKGIDGVTLYCGGSFTASNGGGVTYNYVASINTVTNLISAMGNGFNNYVYALTVGADGVVYAGGGFTSEGAPGTTALYCVAQYKNGSWQPMGNGFNSSVYTLAIDLNGVVHAGGRFYASSGTYSTEFFRGFAKWNGSNWEHIDLQATQATGGTGTGKFILFSSQGETYLMYGSNIAHKVYTAAYTTITNKGTASTSPLMYIKGPGTLIVIENLKSMKSVYFELQISSLEEITIDFAKGIFNSSTRGNLLPYILQGSEIRSLNMTPGDNEIALLLKDDVNGVAQLRWTPRHWSADAVVDAEELY